MAPPPGHTADTADAAAAADADAADGPATTAIAGLFDAGEEEDRDHAGGPPADSLIRAADGRAYWRAVAADDDGMLGGFPHISRVDLRASCAFLAKLGFAAGGGAGGRGTDRVRRALEGGAGIGRITRGLLLDVADAVDVIEPIAKFTAALADGAGVGRIFNVGLEDWRPADGVVYDVIWNQWCVGHLTDRQLVEYLVRCKSVLSRGEDGKVRGVIVVKENLTTSGMDLFDKLDSSVTRAEGKFKQIFQQAELRIVRTELQHGFPNELFPVRMFALKPQ